MKEIAPSNELRKWFSYKKKGGKNLKGDIRELESKKELIEKIRKLEIEHKTIMLLFSAKDVEYNNAVVLKEVVEGERSNIA